MAQGNNKKSLVKKIRKGDKGFPIATVAFYGANNHIATKVVCAIISHEGAEPDPIHKWFSSSDLRKSEQILGEVLCFIDKNEVKTVNMIEEIIGCPHEERMDYPEGDFCPKCSYWKNRDRFSGEMLH
jgi:hypothetical protein